MRRILVLLGAALALAACSGSSSGPGPVDAGCCGPVDAGLDAGPCVDPGRSMPDEGHWHILDGGHWDYISQPPSSGPHWPNKADWGVYDQPVLREQYVHNEEHGGIVLVYNCPSGCDDAVNAFKQIVADQPLDDFGEVKIVVTPDPLYDGGLWAAAAWDTVYTPSSFDAHAFRCFVQAHIDKGPEAAP